MKPIIPFYLYQPIIDLSALNIVRYEALLRIADIPDIESFIIESEKSNCIGEIDRLTLSTVLLHIEQNTRLHGIPVAINISASSLCDAAFQEYALFMLGQRPFKSKISIEITETSPILDILSAKRYVNALKNIGCTVGMDDYGSGYWALSDAKELNLDYIKLSSELTTNLQQPGITAEIEEATAFARRYRMTVVAEHVDNLNQLSQLKALGATHGQGWLFARAGQPYDDRALFQAHMVEKLG